MRKSLLVVVLMVLTAVPVSAEMVQMEMAVPVQIDEGVTLTIEGNSVLVSGAQGQTLEVVSLTGRVVTRYQIESPVQRIELNLGKGCYVLKVGKVVRKVSIR